VGGVAGRRRQPGATAAAAGVAIALCAGCGDPITDQHPHWPGVWVGLTEDQTAHCPSDIGELACYLTYAVELPHHPPPAG
jgi:hypothetical protein